MSASTAWSLTAQATVWPYLANSGWDGVATYGPPEVFACGYSSKSERMTDAKGVEFMTRQTIYTERADIKQRDMVLIGASQALDPLAAGAMEVRLVQRDQDVFDGVADDFQIIT